MEGIDAACGWPSQELFEIKNNTRKLWNQVFLKLTYSASVV